MLIPASKTAPPQPIAPSDPTDDDLFAIKAADNQDRDWLHEQQASPQGFFALTGEEAWNGLDQFRRQTAERIDRTAQSLPSGTAQNVYRSIATARAESVLAKAQTHADTQRAETIKAVSQTRLANAISDGADNWHDLREYNKHLGAGMEEVEADARRQGWDEAQTQQARQTFTSTLAKAAVEKAAATDPHAARALLESLSSHLPNDREQLAKTLNHSILLTDARKMADTVLANSSGQPLEALLGSLSLMPMPDPALKTEAERMICVGFSNKEQAQKKANEQAINQALSLIKAGKAPDELPLDLRNHPAVSSQWDQMWDHALSVAGAPAEIPTPTPPAAPQEQSQTPPVPAFGESQPPRNYGDLAEALQLDRTIGTQAGSKTQAALDAMLTFRNGDDRSQRAANTVTAAIHEASAESPQAAAKLRGVFLDYKTNPLWSPSLMTEQELKNNGANNVSARFYNLVGMSGGITTLAGIGLEASGHIYPSKALGALGRGPSIPMAIIAGIDQYKRKKLEDEKNRRDRIQPDNLVEQLDVTDITDTPVTNAALNSMIMIRDAEDKAAAARTAREQIAQLKQMDPNSAKILHQKLEHYIARPSSVPALLRLDEAEAFLNQGSDVMNYLGMASGVLDTAALVIPPAGLAGAGLSVVSGVLAYEQEIAREKSQAEWDRREKLKGTPLGRRP